MRLDERGVPTEAPVGITAIDLDVHAARQEAQSVAALIGAHLGRSLVKACSSDKGQPDWVAEVMELMAFLEHQDDVETRAAVVRALVDGMNGCSFLLDGGPTRPGYTSAYPHLRFLADAIQSLRKAEADAHQATWLQRHRSRRPEGPWVRDSASGR